MKTKLMRLYTLLVLLLLCISTEFRSQENKEAYQIRLSIQLLEPGPLSNLRGLSVPDSNVCWMSGSGGWVGILSDKGKHAVWKQVSGFKKCDFRSIHAFDSKRALISNAGSPAYIFKTEDGGEHWRKVYENRDTLAFLDGMAFWDGQTGVVVGDPIRGHFLILITHDAGEHWQEMSTSPEAYPGEACFAASGTCISCGKEGRLWIAIGGTHAEVISTSDFGKSWTRSEVPFIHGKDSQGIFSIFFSTENKGIVVGGDYTKDSLTTQNCSLTTDGGKTWFTSTTFPLGYRSCVTPIYGRHLLAIGRKGIDVSNDSGINWEAFGEGGFNVAGNFGERAPLFFAGEKGKIGMLTTY
jgi:photosystem II stability/assembly factor-like uncharacterized protein